MNLNFHRKHVCFIGKSILLISTKFVYLCYIDLSTWKFVRFVILNVLVLFFITTCFKLSIFLNPISIFYYLTFPLLVLFMMKTTQLLILITINMAQLTYFDYSPSVVVYKLAAWEPSVVYAVVELHMDEGVAFAYQLC